jgi:spermidine synthase
MQELPTLEVLQERAVALQPRLERFDMDVREYPLLLDTEVDWNRNARILTDQYSPANLLNN